MVFEPKAIAHDRVFQEEGKEFSRKVRTLTGNYQLVRLAPWLISARNPLMFRFVSHKLLRLAVPLLLILMLTASALSSSPFQMVGFWLQLSFYVLAVVGYVSRPAMALRPIAVANTFLMLNLAAALALYNFATERTKVWTA